MYMYMYVYVYVYIHIDRERERDTCTYIYMFICTHTYTNINTSTDVFYIGSNLINRKLDLWGWLSEDSKVIWGDPKPTYKVPGPRKYTELSAFTGCSLLRNCLSVLLIFKD